MMRQKLSIVTQSLHFPRSCILCHQTHREKHSVCSACIAFFQRLTHPCFVCAAPLPDQSTALCGQCIKKPPYFDKACIAYAFEEPLRSLLHHFKYHEKLYLGHFLSELILHACHLSDTKPQCLIPIPMHPKRIKQRGFNQSVILTRLLAKKLHIPIDITGCQKDLNTLSQANLDGIERQKNLKNAFKCKPMPYTHVALIDDLLTTGATANEVAYTLKKAGVRTVEIWCCARTL